MMSNSAIAITTALIAGAFTFTGLVLGKENKTSEFRQAWIDSLRQEISEFLGNSSHVVSYWIYIHETSDTDEEFSRRNEEFIKRNDDILSKIVALRARIRLRLNPTEHADFIEQLERVYEIVSLGNVPASHEVIRTEVDKLIQNSQYLLKFEWRRVKQGEPAFWITKAVALGVVAGVTLIGLGLHIHWNFVVNG